MDGHAPAVGTANDAARSPEPFGALQVLATVLAMAVTFVGLAALRRANMLQTSAWGYDSHLSGLPFLAQLATLFTGAVTLQVVGARLARPVLAVEGLLCLAAYGPLVTAAALGLLAISFVVLELPVPGWLRMLLALAVLSALGVTGALAIFAQAHLVSLLFSMRLVMYTWDRWQNRFAPAGLATRAREYALYMLAPALIVMPPFLTYIPFFGKFSERITPRWSKALVLRAFKHLWIAAAFAAMRKGALSVPGLVSGSTDVGPTLVFFVFNIVSVAQVAHLTYGLMLLHGMDDRAPINKPLLSKSFVDYWMRFQIHQKDLQVALFYNPMLMRLRKKNRYLAILAAMAWTLLLGNTVLHFFTSYMFDLRWLKESTLSAITANAISTVVLGGTMCLAEWRRRAKRPAPGDAFYGTLCWAATMMLAARTMPR